MIGNCEKKALEILKDYPQIEFQLASLSGRNHVGETCRQHVERCASVMRHLCDGMNIHGDDRDMLIACAYLHDLGIYSISAVGDYTRSNLENDSHPWVYYSNCNISRRDSLMGRHPVLSAKTLDNYDIDRKEEIKRIISVHMGHWYRNTPKPYALFEYLMVLSDFLASRSESLTDYKGEYSK